MQISLKFLGITLISLGLFGCSADNTKVIVLPPAPTNAEITAPAQEIPEIALPKLTPPPVVDQATPKEMPKMFIPDNPNAARNETIQIAEGFAFDKCDSRWQFKNAPWYARFRDQVNTLPNTDETNIATICAANDESLIIAMLNGNTDETGGIVRYQPGTNLLEKATFTSPLSLHFYQFKGRVGTTIPMAGGLKNSDCESDFIVNYEFSRNTLKPIRECKTCNGAAEVCTRLY